MKRNTKSFRSDTITAGHNIASFRTQYRRYNVLFTKNNRANILLSVLCVLYSFRILHINARISYTRDLRIVPQNDICSSFIYCIIGTVVAAVLLDLFRLGVAWPTKVRNNKNIRKIRQKKKKKKSRRRVFYNIKSRFAYRR